MNKRKRAAKRKATKCHKRGLDKLEIMAKSLLGQPITSFRGQPITEADLRRIGIDTKEVMTEWDKNQFKPAKIKILPSMVACDKNTTQKAVELLSKNRGTAMNDKQEKRQAMERWERINDYGDAGVKHTHKKYKHQANRTLPESKRRLANIQA